MNADIDLNAIKSQTRLALPRDDGYLFRLGVAQYGFASLSSFMTEVACHLDDSINLTKLQATTGGVILDSFRQSIKKAKQENPKIGSIGKSAADMFEILNTERSDFIHSYPITNGAKAQILHRRLDSKGKYFEVTNDFLDSFISRLDDVSSKLYEVRRIVRPDLDR